MVLWLSSRLAYGVGHDEAIRLQSSQGTPSAYGVGGDEAVRLQSLREIPSACGVGDDEAIRIPGSKPANMSKG